VDTKLLLEYAMIVESVGALACVILMWRKHLLRDMWGLAAFLSVLGIERAMSLLLLYHRAWFGIDKIETWHIVCIWRWTSELIEYGLLLIVVYGAFRMAMKPLRGLHRAGKMIFRWVAFVSLLLSLGMAFGPRVDDTIARIGDIAGRLQQGTSVLLLCMLVFVCFTTRYLGLTYRSRIFGILLGLGIYSACALVESAWIAAKGQQSVYSPVQLVDAFGFLACLAVWSGYLLAREPERKLVLLPTTSPYFFWNQVSEALGDDPGHVVVAGFTPDMLAPGEIQMLKKKVPATVPGLPKELPAKAASGL
jgi:hypothetical protein